MRIYRHILPYTSIYRHMTIYHGICRYGRVSGLQMPVIDCSNNAVEIAYVSVCMFLHVKFKFVNNHWHIILTRTQNSKKPQADSEASRIVKNLKPSRSRGYFLLFHLSFMGVT